PGPSTGGNAAPGKTSMLKTAGTAAATTAATTGASMLLANNDGYASPGIATRDEAEIAARRARELRGRRGSAADIVTGVRGAEAAASSLGKFVLGN
ncbi:MAG: hypothetical protein VX309_03895, partial [Pseudomonadota bacterium]|nr:hypothetical protein [Pseudomonadota bacterium]